MKMHPNSNYKKISTVFFIFLAFLTLILASEVIYTLKNRPGVFGNIFLYLAKNDVNYEKLEKAIKNLDRAANLHLKENKIKYSDKIKVTSINSNLANVDIETRKKITEFLTNVLTNTKGYNYSKVSNIYYKIGLSLYEKGYHELANSFFLSSVLLDPTLSFVHVELANSYFNNGEFEKGMESLNYCLSFDPPHEHCSDYIAENVNSNFFLKVGFFEDVIDGYQLENF